MAQLILVRGGACGGTEEEEEEEEEGGGWQRWHCASIEMHKLIHIRPQRKKQALPADKWYGTVQNKRK